MAEKYEIIDDCLIIKQGVKELHRSDINEIDYKDIIAFTDVVLPESLEVLGESVFSGFLSLSRIKLPEGLKEIHDFAFFESGLVSVDIPDSVESLGTSVFGSCKKLVRVKLPTGLKIVPNSCFNNTTSLEEIEFPTVDFKIGFDAFNRCGIRSLTVPHNCYQISSYGFYCSDLQELIISTDTKFTTNSFLSCNIKTVSYQINFAKILELSTSEKISIDVDGSFTRFTTPDSMVLVLDDGRIEQVSKLEFNEFTSSHLNNLSEVHACYGVHYFYECQRLSKNYSIYGPELTILTELYGYDAPSRYFPAASFYLKFKARNNISDKESRELLFLAQSLGLFETDEKVRGKAINTLNILSENRGFLFNLLKAVEQLDCKKVNMGFANFVADNIKELMQDNEFGLIPFVFTQYDEIQSGNKNKFGHTLKLTLNYARKYLKNLNSSLFTDDSPIYMAAFKYYCGDNAAMETLSSFYKIACNIQEQIDAGNMPNFFAGAVDSNFGKYKYDYLRKDDVNYLLLGNICDCCGRVNGVGEDILKTTCSNYEYSFLAIRDEQNNIVGKCSISYNFSKNLLVLNNIEINEQHKWQMSDNDKIDMLNTLVRATKDLKGALQQINSKPFNAIIGNTFTNDLKDTISEHCEYIGEPYHVPPYGSYPGDAFDAQFYLVKNDVPVSIIDEEIN